MTWSGGPVATGCELAKVGPSVTVNSCRRAMDWLLGAAVSMFLINAHCATTQIFKNSSVELKGARWLQTEQDMSRMYLSAVKEGLTRIIKSYRAVKPEMNLVMCFSHYAGITSRGKRAATMEEDKKDKDDKEVTVQKLVMDIVHFMMMIMSDVMPEPMMTMVKMVTELWTMSREMYKAVKGDEMGGCSLEYMSKRFWWWLGFT